MYLYNSMQHISFPSLLSDKWGFWIHRCWINQSPLYVHDHKAYTNVSCNATTACCLVSYVLSHPLPLLVCTVELSFRELVQGKEVYNVCRIFAATLQLVCVTHTQHTHTHTCTHARTKIIYKTAKWDFETASKWPVSWAFSYWHRNQFK